MTKVDFDMPSQQGERCAIAPADLARRFEWRLQREKSQLEQWQVRRQVSGHKMDLVGPETERSEGGEKIAGETRTQPELHTAQLFDIRLSGPSHTSGPSRGDRANPLSLDCKAGLDNIAGYNAPAMGDTSIRAIQTSAKTLQQGRIMPMPFSRQTYSANMHIYQMDGKVEVALRNTGLKGRSGEKLIAGLKRNLASLGLVLTRLTLNGELIWQSDTNASCCDAPYKANDAPIDRIY
jgi:hypothetical protein